MSTAKLKDLAIKIHRVHGDALAGERIIAQARHISRFLVVPGTSRHRIQEVVLKMNALCVLDRPFRLKDQAVRVKNPGT